MTTPLPPYPGPTKELSVNYTANGQPFAIGDEGEDDLDERDLYRLSRATEDHNHGVGRGLPVNRIGTTTTPQAAGDIGVEGDDFTWWGDVSNQALAAVNTSTDQTVNGIKRINAPVLIPRQVSTPPAPGSGLAYVYLGPGDRLYLRAGTNQPTPVGTPTLLGAALAWQNNDPPAGYTPSQLTQVLTTSGPLWVQAFRAANLDACTLATVAPPAYGGTPITVVADWLAMIDTPGKINFTLLCTVVTPGGGIGSTAPTARASVTVDFPGPGAYTRTTLNWVAGMPQPGDLLQFTFARNKDTETAAGTPYPNTVSVISIDLTYG